MESETAEWTAVMNRLERLEKQNRRMKQMGVLTLVLLGSVLLMGQAASKRTVEANEFVLKDQSGKVRGQFNMNLFGQPELIFLDQNQNTAARLKVDKFGPSIALYYGHSDITLEADVKGASLGLSDPAGHTRAILGTGRTGSWLAFYDATSENDSEKAQRTLLQEKTLELSDKEGFQTTIGAADLQTLRTGETHKTSAASVTLFDKDKKVLWKAL